MGRRGRKKIISYIKARFSNHVRKHTYIGTGGQAIASYLQEFPKDREFIESRLEYFKRRAESIVQKSRGNHDQP